MESVRDDNSGDAPTRCVGTRMIDRNRAWGTAGAPSHEIQCLGHILAVIQIWPFAGHVRQTQSSSSSMPPYQHINIRRLRLYRTLLLPLLLLLGLPAAGAQPVAGSKQPIPAVSIIEIPVQLSLDPLTRAAEKTLPLQAGHWRTWKDWHGIQSQYRAWRGPLSITVSGDVLLVQAHIRYWIRAQKKVLGAINLKGSCGIDEPPRQALIGMQVRLGWGPDWTVRPEFRILPTRFLDRCEMTIANIDVTPLVEKEFRKQMQKSLQAALRTFAPGMNSIRKQAQRSWFLLQQPVELGQDNWLTFRPVGVALSGITGRGNNIDAHLAVALQPALVAGAEPAVKPVRLPPLERYYPRSSGLNLQLGVSLDFANLNQRISDTLGGQSFNINGQKAGINKFVLAGSGQEISARVELVGDVAGTVELQARLVYEAEERKLEVQDLTFDYDARNSTMALLEKSFHEYIRQTLEGMANQALAQYLELVSERLENVLERIMPAGVLLDMSALQLRSLQIHIEQQNIRLDGAATGSARFTLR